MKTLRVMSIIGIIWTTLFIYMLMVFQQEAYAYASKENIDGLAGAGFLAGLYALAFCIVALVQAGRLINQAKQKGAFKV